MIRFTRVSVIAALAIAGSITAGSTVEAAGEPALLGGAEFSLQNYFNSGGELTPFFEQIDGSVGGGVEIEDDYIYDIDFRNSSIVMRWNTAPQWDAFEPYVGAIGGAPQDVAASLPIADEYHITFNTDISGLRFSAESNKSLQPEVRVEGADTLVISIPGGTDIGDGFDAKIKVRPPVQNIRGLDFSLQNYFNFGGDLSPFFDQIDGTVGSGVEIDSGYIYDINLVNRQIAMTWNTGPDWDMFEPYVGALAGLSQDAAAMLPIADEYHFTFSEKVSHFDVVTSPASDIDPDTRFEDDYTLVIAIPGGTTIGDGVDLRVSLMPRTD